MVCFYTHVSAGIDKLGAALVWQGILLEQKLWNMREWNCVLATVFLILLNRRIPQYKGTFKQLKMKDFGVYGVALNENMIPVTPGSSFNICEHVQVPLRAEQPGGCVHESGSVPATYGAFWNKSFFLSEF